MTHPRDNAPQQAPATPPAKANPDTSTSEDLVAELRAELRAERAWSLRLEGYVAEVLAAPLPDPGDAVLGWEAPDFPEYWATAADRSLSTGDRDRRLCYGGVPVPIILA